MQPVSIFDCLTGKSFKNSTVPRPLLYYCICK